MQCLSSAALYENSVNSLITPLLLVTAIHFFFMNTAAGAILMHPCGVKCPRGRVLEAQAHPWVSNLQFRVEAVATS